MYFVSSQQYVVYATIIFFLMHLKIVSIVILLVYAILILKKNLKLILGKGKKVMWIMPC